jgi:hypothetical protein
MAGLVIFSRSLLKLCTLSTCSIQVLHGRPPKFRDCLKDADICPQSCTSDSLLLQTHCCQVKRVFEECKLSHVVKIIDKIEMYNVEGCKIF